MSTKIYYWPNNVWCYEDELHLMSHLLDDYILLDVGDKTWEEIDQAVTELNGGVYEPLL